MKSVGKAFGGTLNDVAVTIVDAALNRYLQDRGEPPSKPLVAMCPLSLRDAGDKEATTKVSALFVPLGKARTGIGARMDQVMAAIGSAKAELRGMSKDAAMLYAILAFGLSEAAGATRADRVTRPLANFVLSNVPGPSEPLYFGSTRIENWFSTGQILDACTLNMTVWSYAGKMNLNVVADSKVVRDGWVLIDYFQECLVELLDKIGHETRPASAHQTHETAA